MAIEFITPVNPSKLRMAFNNDVLQYQSLTSVTLPRYSTVKLRDTPTSTVDNISLMLYPAPDGTFFINLKSYLSALSNKERFQDKLNPDINTLQADSFVYNGTPLSYLEQILFIDVVDSDGFVTSVNYRLRMINGVEQIGQPAHFGDNGILGVYILTAPDVLSTNHYHIKYWEGYPFDLSIYTRQSRFKLLNETNALQQVFTSKGIVNRLVFSDGRTDETLNDVLPLVEGFNRLTLIQGATSVPAVNRYITLEKVPYKCGVYFKWFNSNGAYSYWLFEHSYSLDRSIKQIGELENDNTNVDVTTSPTLQIGSTSQDTIRVIAELITPEERELFLSILDSPKILMFTGQPMARNNANSWVEVTLKTSGVRIKNPREALTNFTLDFDLPVRYNQSL